MALEKGKFYTLLGPSGCGKTTILRIIAGFTNASSGDVLFEGKRMNDLPANKRQVNTVFQDYALFPHLNVFDNVAFGLNLRKVKKSDVEKKVIEALNLYVWVAMNTVKSVNYQVGSNNEWQLPVRWPMNLKFSY